MHLYCLIIEVNKLDYMYSVFDFVQGRPVRVYLSLQCNCCMRENLHSKFRGNGMFIALVLLRDIGIYWLFSLLVVQYWMEQMEVHCHTRQRKHPWICYCWLIQECQDCGSQKGSRPPGKTPFVAVHCTYTSFVAYLCFLMVCEIPKLLALTYKFVENSLHCHVVVWGVPPLVMFYYNALNNMEFT